MADLFDFIDAPAEKKTGDIFDSLGGTPDYVPPEIAQSEAQQAIEQNFRAPQWANNAAEALQGTLGGFVPRSMHDVAGLLTPATGSIDEVIKAARIAKDVANGATPEEATRRHSPESFQLADAEQTPPYSKERFQAGFDTVAQMLMAAGIAKGHAKAGEVPKGDNLKQESGTPLMTAESQMVSPDTSSRTTEPTVQSPAAIQEPSAIRSQPVPQSDVNTPSVEPSTNQNQGIKEPQAESGATGQAAFEANLLHGSPNPNLSEVSSAPSFRQYDNATSVFGAFFTARPNEAANYAGKGGKVYPVRVRIDNPKEMRWNEFAYFQDIVKDSNGKSLPGEQWGARAEELKQEALALRQQLEAEGYDGIVVRDVHGQPIEVASFKNVKIDTGTASGLKSPQSSSINEGRQRGPATSESAQPQPASQEAPSVPDAPAANPQGGFLPKANPEPQPASDTTGQTARIAWERQNELNRQEENLNLKAESIYNDALEKSTGPKINREVEAEAIIARNKRIAQTMTRDPEILESYNRAHQMASQMVEAKLGSLAPENRLTKYVDYEPEVPQEAGLSPESVPAVEPPRRSAETVSLPNAPTTAPEKTRPSPVVEPSRLPEPRVPNRPAQPEATPTGEEPSRVGIAHSYGEERFPGEIDRGEGTNVETQVARGRDLLNRGVDPGQIVRRVEKTGRISGDDMAVLRAQLETLQHTADTAAEAARTNPDPVLQRAAEQAMQNELAWRKTIKPAATAFHEIGMTLQGQAEVNYGTFAGLRRAAVDLHGKDVNPAQAATLKEVANRVRRENQLATESLQRATTQVEQTFGRKAPARSVEQLRNDLANRLRELTPC